MKSGKIKYCQECRNQHRHEQHLRVPPVPRDQGAHLDRFCKGSRLHSIFGDAYAVNSFHHQAVKELGTGFTATAFSEDGLIEGIEKENVTAVQWHPERMMRSLSAISTSRSSPT